MKKITFKVQFIYIALLTLAIAGLSGCSKSGGEANTDDSEKYFTCKINGKYREFNYMVNANDKPATDTVHFVVIGGWEKQDMITGFGINMQLAEGAKEATYYADGNSDLLLAGKYYIQNMKDGKIVGTTIYNGGDLDGSNFTLTITSLTKWGVKGTFSGKLRLLGSDEVVTVTEGKFSAPYN
ncbi:hypothetical protein LJ707_02730 [Mucilaginibacter sp. UR6-1]|uniref:hypothetical protein n=1 Tax=Mucilaginibacter sp. UR6-1 TaxID=1435643 RepID=UPI001E3C7B71|nr:hypothetical protein [Mucilaginibacter sp. UR6-1]MCC8407827.1 hypothetical protein [Mucilaginibacter sp. UR6-1]